jgi:hypothetical protein
MAAGRKVARGTRERAFHGSTCSSLLQFVREHDLRCEPPCYSAYPDRTVLDIQATTEQPV